MSHSGNLPGPEECEGDYDDDGDVDGEDLIEFIAEDDNSDDMDHLSRISVEFGRIDC